MEWNDPKDVELASRTFKDWADAVRAKDKARVESFHDESFLVRMGGRLLGKEEHVQIEMTVENSEMTLVELEATRRIGNVLLVWSKHFIRADAVPAIPALGLGEQWFDQEAVRKGFVQAELTVWRQEGDRLRCLAFDIGAMQPSN